jgi:hypothetical protein
MRHLTLTLFLRSTDCYIYIKFLWLAKFHYYQTTFPGLTLGEPRLHTNKEANLIMKNLTK